MRLLASVAPSVRVPAAARPPPPGDASTSAATMIAVAAVHGRCDHRCAQADAAPGVTAPGHVSPGQVTLLMTESARP